MDNYNQGVVTNFQEQNETYEQYPNSNIDTNYIGPTQTQIQTEDTNQYGLASMICGIISILFGSLIIGIPLGIAAIILANKSTNPKEKEYKTIGKITGIVGLSISALLTLFFTAIIALGLFSSTMY